MSASLGTLTSAERFEGAGFAPDHARAVPAVFGQASEGTREGLATKEQLDLRLAGFALRPARQVAGTGVRLTRLAGETGKGLTGRRWSTSAIIAGVSTAITKTIGRA